MINEWTGWRPRPSRRHGRHGPRLGAAVLLSLLAASTLAGCTRAASPTGGDGGASGRQAGAAPTSAAPTTTTTIAGRIGDGQHAALANRDLAALSAPGGTVAAVFPARQPWGDPTVFLVKAYQTDASGKGWYQVLLPRRPNGSTGWVQADHVRVERRPRALEVDLSARQLQLRDGNRVLSRASVAIGAQGTPTPTGSYFITAKLKPPHISPIFGAWALALSAYSDVLEQFGTGDGQVALHGTANASELGRAVSSGCIRLDNRTVTELAALLPLGTPVTIKA